jgi:para-nitrobenzyl esterase
VIDGKFLPAQPMELIRQGSARGIPTMIGHTRDEYRYFMTPEMAAKVPIAGKALSHFKASATGALVEAYARAFPELSLGDRNLRILGADLITLPTTRLAEAQAALAAPVHFYAVHYCVPGGPFARYSAHGIDVPLIFDKLDSLFARQQFGYSAKDEPMALTVSATWASFIKTGVPQDAAGDWRAFDTEDRAAMIFDEPVRMVRDPDQKEREIWDALGAGLN